MSKLRDSSINLGGSTPASLPAVPHVRPAALTIDTPRDNGGLAIGQTGGNFAQSGMGKVPNNAGATGTEAGAAASKAAQAENGL